MAREIRDLEMTVAAVEVMVVTIAIRNLIREGKTYQLMNTMETGSQYGMQTLNKHSLPYTITAS